MDSDQAELIPQELIEKHIYLIRGYKVMFDTNLADLYQVETKAINRAVKRNLLRFPKDFCFQLTQEETDSLRYQFGTLKKNRGTHRKYLPFVFTEQGVAMLSSVLKSKRAIMVNVQIMRTFVQLREMLISNKELAQKLGALEKKYNHQFKIVFDAIRQLMAEPEPKKNRQIGFKGNSMDKISRLS
jgi:hypothetical protein